MKKIFDGLTMWSGLTERELVLLVRERESEGERMRRRENED